MIEKSSPLIKIDHQDGFRPIRAGGDSGVDLIEKRFAVPDVAMRVIIIGCVGSLARETGIYISYVRQGSGSGVAEKLRERL